jgi:hypothetical protein
MNTGRVRQREMEWNIGEEAAIETKNKERKMIDLLQG